MLQNIRERAQGWIAWVVIIFICATFALWGIHSYLSLAKGSSSKNNVVAKVNHDKIEQGQLNTVYERMRQQEQMQLGADYTNNPVVETRLKKQALNQLIMSDILSQAALKDGYRISDRQIDAAILKMPAFQVDGIFSKDRFQEILSSTLYTQEAFFGDLYRALLISQVQAGFVESGFVLPSDVERAVQLVNQRRSLSYLIIPMAKFLAESPASDQAAMEFYRAHQDKFAVPEQIKVAYLELSVPEISAKLQFDVPTLRQFYKDNLNAFTQPERWHVAHILIKVPRDASRVQVEAAQEKIKELRNKITSGEQSFSALAEKYSDDVLSAQQEGKLAWMSRGSLDPQFDQVVSTLKVGQVSSPIRTKYGFHIIKLLAEKPAEIQPFNKVKRQVQEALAQQKAEQILATESDKLSSLTYANPNTLSVAAQALNLPVKMTEFFTREGAHEGMASNPKFVAAAFSADVMRENNSDVIPISVQKLVVLRIQERIPATTKPFDEVKDKILLQLKIKEAQKRAAQMGETVLSAIKAGKNREQVASSFHLNWVNRQDVGRFASTVNPLILSEAFRLPKPAESKISAKGVNLPDGGFAVLVVTEVHDGHFNKQANMEKRIFHQQLESKNGQVDYQLYVHNLLSRAKVSILDDNLKDKAKDKA